MQPLSPTHSFAPITSNTKAGKGAYKPTLLPHYTDVIPYLPIAYEQIHIKGAFFETQ